MENNSHKASRIIGQIFGMVVVGCVATCFASALIALTVKFITFMF